MNNCDLLPTKVWKVLLVDDSGHIAQVIQSHLNDPSIDLTVSTDGREGFETFRKANFDVVLMDLHMPEMDGCEAVRAIRFWERRNNLWPTPIAALTADSSRSSFEQAFGAGCTHYLVKPIRRETLLQTVGRPLRHLTIPGPTEPRVFRRSMRTEVTPAPAVCKKGERFVGRGSGCRVPILRLRSSAT